MLEQLLLEFFKFRLEGLCSRYLVGFKDFVESVADVCKSWNNDFLVVAEPEEGGESDVLLWFRPLADFVELGRVGIDIVFGHDSAEVVDSLSEK